MTTPTRAPEPSGPTVRWWFTPGLLPDGVTPTHDKLAGFVRAHPRLDHAHLHEYGLLAVLEMQLTSVRRRG